MEPDTSRWRSGRGPIASERIRVQVSSGAHPRFARNLGTGELLATATTHLIADQTIYHDPEHPSAILLPIR